jgi:hypothetical protein
MAGLQKGSNGSSILSAILPLCNSAILLLAIACSPPSRSQMTAAAHDDWVRAYTLADGGEVNIGNPRGAVDIEAVEGQTVEIRVERIVHAVTEAAAAEVLPRLQMTEEISPEKVVVSGDRLGGIVIGVSVEMRFHVRAPKRATIRARTTGGEVRVKGFGGHVVVTGSNGSVNAEGLAGGIETRWVNGGVKIALASFGTDLVDARVTNGPLTLVLPTGIDANLSATATNGKIEVKAQKFEPLGDQTARRVRGRFNAGGPPIELTTVNGSISVETQ